MLDLFKGTFSFAFWPSAIKLLWAPLVDSFYFKRIGKRKSWFVPCQLFLGIVFLCSAEFIHDLVVSDKSKQKAGN